MKLKHFVYNISFATFQTYLILYEVFVYSRFDLTAAVSRRYSWQVELVVITLKNRENRTPPDVL